MLQRKRKKVRIFLESQAEIYRNELPAAVLKDLIRKTTHKDPYYFKMRAMGFPTDNLSPYIATHEDRGPRIAFWRGCRRSTGISGHIRPPIRPFVLTSAVTLRIGFFRFAPMIIEPYGNRPIA